MDGEYADFVDRYLQPVSISGREVMCMCLFHDDHNASMQFNLDKGLFTCFSCAAGGSIKKIYRHLGIDPGVKTGVGLDVIYRKLNDLRRGVDLDTGPRLMREAELDRFKVPTKYWKAERGLSDSTIQAFDLGYDIAQDAVTIPVRTMNGDLLGVTRRFLEADPVTRYRYPKGFHKSDHLFGSWMVANDHSGLPVALTEGAIDTMTLWQWGVPAMAVYGSHISEAQIRIMRRLGLTRINLFFDNDAAGQKLVKRCRGFKQQSNDRWEYSRELDLRRFFDVHAVNWSGISRLRAKDVNDLDIIKARNLVANALPLG